MPSPRWGEPPPGLGARIAARARAVLRPVPPESLSLPELPLALRHGEIAERYLGAERAMDHRRAAAAAVAAMDESARREEWWAADIWGHRGLWHFERVDMTLQAARQARRIGDLRVRAGDPESARRYYAEAIDEARDIGAEHEQGLAAEGLGRALLELGRVTEARRLASAAVDLLVRSGALEAEVASARELMGREVPVSGTKEG